MKHKGRTIGIIILCVVVVLLVINWQVQPLHFPQCGEKPDIATLPVKACDLKCIPVMHASCNEEIKARFEKCSYETKDQS